MNTIVKNTFLLIIFCFLSQTVPAQEAENFRMGTNVNPQGETIRIDSRSLLHNDQPVLPVMGEIHFSRLPEKEWRQELLKMKAGGIDIIASYIFWIHHEEIQREYNWSGQRNLNQFVQLCRELEFKLILRIGPWCHGEVRNGGFPEWMIRKGFRLRDNNPGYLNEVRTWYNQIYRQIEGQLWKDGGPVIGIQIENEYRGRWEHLATLKSMAIESGFDVPLYTRTGWPQLGSPAVFGEIIPLYGDYADGFWDRSLQEMPGDYSKSFLFRPFRSSTVIATEQLPKQPDKGDVGVWAYPYFTCELGGGMTPSYHRRICIHPMDVYAMTLVRIGSGSNLPGYYMYHGGTNPEGKLSTLNEEQATGMTNYNDLPVKTYDFQAPLGEFGQVNGQYHLLRKLHLFLHDYGNRLALMNPYFPAKTPDYPDDDSALRWNVRHDGKSGFVFVNNYRRLKTSSKKDNIRFTVDLPEEKLAFPESPVSVASGLAFFMPFNMRMGEARLKYATAQPVANIAEDNELTFFFAEIPGISADFVFDTMRFTNLKAGREKAISFQDAANRRINIVLLDEESSLALWKGKLSGKDRVFLTDTNVETVYHNNELRLSADKDSIFVSIYPAPESLRCENEILKGVTDGVFTRYTVKTPAANRPEVELKQIRKHGKLRQIAMGNAKVAESPKDKDFEQAAAWQVTFPAGINPERDMYLQIPYRGDVARIYSGNQLLTDNFYNGKVFELGLKRFAPEVYANGLTVQILPLQKEAPIYFQSGTPLDFTQADHLIDLPEIRIYEKRQVVLISE